jgi:SagB-type dehydrogenase family enzyme
MSVEAAEESALFTLALIESASIEEDGTSLRVQTPPQAHRPPLRFAEPAPGLRAALRAIASGGATLSSLAALVAADGVAGFAALHGAVAQLDRCALLARSAHAGAEPLAHLEPTSLYYRHDPGRVEEGAPWVLSRFACLRREGERLIVESPLGHARVRLAAPAAVAALGALGTPRTSKELSDAVPALDEAAARRLMILLADAGALAASAPGQPRHEDSDPALAQWEFHDLLFHTRSRLGRHANGFGGTYRFQGRFEPLPVVKPPMGEEAVALHRPDLERLAREDRPFSAVLEARRSVREQGEVPIHADQLGEFLFRAARIQKMAEKAGVSFRPHPGGGALHELEIYPVIHRCQGLDSGLYHYDASGHRLEKLAPTGRYLDALLQMAAVTAELTAPPQVLLVVAARFQRIQLKYQSMAYSVILKNVGALYQTMYLVATAMGLAPCGLGGGHADLFAAAASLDYYAETSVGEFILGSARA